MEAVRVRGGVTAGAVVTMMVIEAEVSASPEIRQEYSRVTEVRAGTGIGTEVGVPVRLVRALKVSASTMMVASVVLVRVIRTVVGVFGCSAAVSFPFCVNVSLDTNCNNFAPQRMKLP